MAGKRQHYIPQFLQRGFLATTPEEAERTWLHRRGTKARLVSIRDVGVREHFYSNLAPDGTTTLDGLITELESNFNAELSVIRRGTAEAPIEPQVAARLVTHFALRTAHVRSVFSKGAAQVIEEIAGLFTDTDGLRDYLGVDEPSRARAESPLVDQVLKAISLAAISAPPPLLKRVVAFLIRENFDEFYRKQHTVITQVVDGIGKGVASMVRDGHNKALLTSDTSRWESDLSLLHWRTHSVVGAVLPDCVVLARETGGTFTPLALSDREKVDLVVLPIAHDRLLVGSAFTNVDVSIDAINEASASCSDSFFISHDAHHGFALSGLIGQRCSQAIDAVLADARSSIRRPEGVQTVSLSPGRAFEVESVGAFSFSLSCLNFGDAETCARLGEVLRAVVQEVGRDMPLSALDGVTFAVDYASALETFDRGDPTLGVDRTEERSYGRAVAKCLRVVRGAEVREHIVVDSIIANALLMDDEAVRASAVHTIVSMLACVAHAAVYERQLVGQTTQAADSVAAMLHRAASKAPGRYFAARESAFADPSAGERYADLVRDSLAFARESIQERRLAYRMSNDLDQLVEVSLFHMSHVMAHAAEWLGHRDGLPSQEAFPGSSLPEDLRVLGLNLWLELFGRDLRRLYDDSGQFTSANVLALTSHVERLLWTVQICPWVMEDGTAYVSVPMGEDERLLASRVA